jgi:pimeloyl-ACP methyl ester carboxylesterase
MSATDAAVRFDHVGPEPHDVPRDGRSGFATADGRQVHYLEWGPSAAPLVVALHGGGQTSYMFEELGSALHGSYHVIAPDLPGHGESSPLPTPEEFTREALTATLPPLLDAFGAGPATFVGASLGGILSLTLAATDSRRVHAIALIDVGHKLEADGVRRIVEFLGKHESFGSLEEAAAAVAEYAPQRGRVEPTRLRRNLRQRDDGRWVWKHNLGRVTADRLEQEGWESSIVAGLDDELATIAVPVLVLRGAASDVLSSDGAAEIASKLPDARLVEVSNAGHLAAGDNPTSTVELIRSFLNEVMPA